MFGAWSPTPPKRPTAGLQIEDAGCHGLTVLGMAVLFVFDEERACNTNSEKMFHHEGTKGTKRAKVFWQAIFQSPGLVRRVVADPADDRTDATFGLRNRSSFRPARASTRLNLRFGWPGLD